MKTPEDTAKRHPHCAQCGRPSFLWLLRVYEEALKRISYGPLHPSVPRERLQEIATEALKDKGKGSRWRTS